ncbi:hypothetical protein E1B28_006763 [Marasmius oreades]|uniref:Uncharacterized protein n=1 Tax=Marasmius oreades TaxID=181124 RepID=A0A9P8AAJ8_9AGAR|nr:uncharacterized protein E1B28_006763 [Marasmius oreades]KAG7096087.1 hypothetical protein E1B28_006763 [Marasmius oreades]
MPSPAQSFLSLTLQLKHWKMAPSLTYKQATDKQSHPKWTVTLKDIPSWHCDNVYILTGYRRQGFIERSKLSYLTILVKI